MKVIPLISLIYLICFTTSCFSPPKEVNPKIQNYFDTVERHCSENNIAEQGELFAEKFEIHFTRPDGAVESFTQSRKEHIKYLTNFLAERPDYKYEHKVLEGEIRKDGSAFGKILVNQSYTENGKFLQTIATETVELEPVGDSYQTTKMTIVMKVKNKE